MTARDIGQAVGRSERRVQEWAKKAGDKMSSVAAKIAAAGHGTPADYDFEEVCTIIEVGMGKNAAGIYRMNAQAQRDTESSARLERLEGLVERFLGAVVSLMPSGAPASRPELSASPLLPPPEIGPREALRKVLEEWARSHGRDYHEAYSNLYREYRYRYHVDISRLAKTKGLSVLDYAENEAILGQLLALAYFLYGRKEGVGA